MNDLNTSEVRAFFNKLAPVWDAEMIRSDRIIGEILDIAGVTDGVRVLDVGCGTGVLFPDYLARNVRSLTGVDLSPAMIAIAREKFPDPRVTLLTADAESAEFAAPFDCCLVYNAFPHFPDPARLIGHLTRSLDRGGRLTVAHGMSREKINAHHSGSAQHVSLGLPEAETLARMFAPGLIVDVTISDDEKYIVSGVRQ